MRSPDVILGCCHAVAGAAGAQRPNAKRGEVPLGCDPFPNLQIRRNAPGLNISKSEYTIG